MIYYYKSYPIYKIPGCNKYCIEHKIFSGMEFNTTVECENAIDDYLDNELTDQ